MLKKIKKKFIYPLKYSHIKKSVNCESRWYGNNYGGFYLNPQLLNEQSIVYSFGIGEDISFDKQVIQEHKCKVFGFDPTPKSINWCLNNDLPETFKFHEFGISKNTGKTNFHLPINSEHVSGSLVPQKNVSQKNTVEVQMKSFSDICKLLKHKKIAVIKMDIEGSEYDVIESILEKRIQIDQMAIELHERFFENGRAKSKALIKKMKKHGYEIFAVSDSYEEISFINNRSFNNTNNVLK